MKHLTPRVLQQVRKFFYLQKPPQIGQTLLPSPFPVDFHDVLTPARRLHGLLPLKMFMSSVTDPKMLEELQSKGLLMHLLKTGKAGRSMELIDAAREGDLDEVNSDHIQPF